MLYPPYIMGGAEKSVELLAGAQLAKGHDVAAACIAPTGPVREDRKGIRVYRMPHETDFWPEEWPRHSKLARGWRRFKQQYNYRLERHFADAIRDFRPDLVNTHSLVDVSTRVWEAAHDAKIPIVHTLRDYDLACANAAMFKNGAPCQSRHIKCRIFNYKKWEHHRHVKAVVGVGSRILSDHVAMGYFANVAPNLRRVIWNAAVVEGIAEDYVRPTLTGSRITFGYLGRINVEKGVGTLIDACRTLPEGTWNLAIAGRAVEGDTSMEQRAQGLPIDFLGFVSPKEFFERIDVLVVPSIWAEPLPRTILESYASGVPALGAAAGGIPDLVGVDNTNWLFDPGNVEDLAAKMRRIIEQGRAALPRKGHFESVLAETTPPLVADRYLQLYDEVLG